MLMGLTLEVLTPIVKVVLSLQGIGLKKCTELWTLEFGIVELYFQLNDAGKPSYGSSSSQLRESGYVLLCPARASGFVIPAYWYSKT